MKISLTLNSEKITLDYSPDKTLMNILRDQGCLSIKSGCGKGFCGSCTVLMDGNPVPSCKVPLGLARNSEIITLEYFTKTSEYKSIMSGFKKAGISLCGYCNAGKIFGTYRILCMAKKMEREDIAQELKSLSPCCVDMDTLINGVAYALRDYSANGDK